MQVRNSLAQPVLGGDVRLSRGTAVLAPQGGLEVERAPPGQKEDDLVQKAFTVLSRKEGLAKQLAKPQVTPARPQLTAWPLPQSSHRVSGSSDTVLASCVKHHPARQSCRLFSCLGRSQNRCGKHVQHQCCSPGLSS